jgi:hypothetical protein
MEPVLELTKLKPNSESEYMFWLLRFNHTRNVCIQNLVYLDSHFCNKLYSTFQDALDWRSSPIQNNKGNISVTIFLFFLKKFENYWPHLDSDFSVVEFFKLVILPFSQVVETCRHLIINSSWDASCWPMTQHEKIEKHITDSHLWHHMYIDRRKLLTSIFNFILFNT